MPKHNPMTTLANRQIIVGITGGIAAYKAAELTRLLRQHDASVRVVMTVAAQEFITPLTMQALSGNPVHNELLDTEAEGAMGHIELARWADAVLIAPASADFIANLAQGMASELLSAVCLASDAPILVAPAMNQGMWNAPSTHNNINSLRKNGAYVLGPASGEQACGDIGMGRMLEPEQLCASLADIFSTHALDGVQVIITAGGTREPIDPVRYIGNRSSGRMAYALARAATDAGAKVTLISCANLPVPENSTYIPVETALEMHAAIQEHLAQCQIYIGAAAIADFRPQQVHSKKMDRSAGDISVALKANPDIIANIASSSPRPFVVGFAAEVDDMIKKASAKMQRKNLDMICANQISQEGIGFDSEENEIHVLWDDKKQRLKRASKSQIATQLVALIAKQYRVYKGNM